MANAFVKIFRRFVKSISDMFKQSDIGGGERERARVAVQDTHGGEGMLPEYAYQNIVRFSDGNVSELPTIRVHTYEIRMYLDIYSR